MSLLFVNYDRTYMCNHEGVLGRPLEDGTRMCFRCGKIVQLEQSPETFTRPAGHKTGRLPTRMVR